MRGRWILKVYRATYLSEEGQYDISDELFMKCSTHLPKIKQLYLNWGGMKIHHKQYNEAIEILNKALEIDSNYGKAHYNLGIAYIKIGKIDKGISHLQKAFKIKPKLFRLYLSDPDLRQIQIPHPTPNRMNIKEVRSHNQELFNKYRKLGFINDLILFMILPFGLILTLLFLGRFHLIDELVASQALIILSSVWLFILSLHYKKFSGYYENIMNLRGKIMGKTFMVGIFSESAKIMAGEGMPPPCEHHVNES
ncbi:MAG: tetratricopeptide repeat protein [Candidatus Thermoplasmatota archaeon]